MLGIKNNLFYSTHIQIYVFNLNIGWIPNQRPLGHRLFGWIPGLSKVPQEF